MRKTAIFKHDLFLMHDPGQNHPERIDRLRVIYRFIDNPEVNKNFIFPSFAPADIEHIERNHALMVIMGTHGIKGLQKYTGSWALKVIIGSSVPFLVIQDKPNVP